MSYEAYVREHMGWYLIELLAKYHEMRRNFLFWTRDGGLPSDELDELYDAMEDAFDKLREECEFCSVTVKDVAAWAREEE